MTHVSDMGNNNSSIYKLIRSDRVWLLGSSDSGFHEPTTRMESSTVTVNRTKANTPTESTVKNTICKTKSIFSSILRDRIYDERGSVSKMGYWRRLWHGEGRRHDRPALVLAKKSLTTVRSPLNRDGPDIATNVQRRTKVHTHENACRSILATASSARPRTAASPRSYFLSRAMARQPSKRSVDVQVVPRQFVHQAVQHQIDLQSASYYACCQTTQASEEVFRPRSVEVAYVLAQQSYLGLLLTASHHLLDMTVAALCRALSNCVTFNDDDYDVEGGYAAIVDLLTYIVMHREHTARQMTDDQVFELVSSDNVVHVVLDCVVTNYWAQTHVRVVTYVATVCTETVSVLARSVTANDSLSAHARLSIVHNLSYKHTESSRMLLAVMQRVIDPWQYTDSHLLAPEECMTSSMLMQCHLSDYDEALRPGRHRSFIVGSSSSTLPSLSVRLSPDCVNIHPYDRAYPATELSSDGYRTADSDSSSISCGNPRRSSPGLATVHDTDMNVQFSNSFGNASTTSECLGKSDTVSACPWMAREDTRRFRSRGDAPDSAVTVSLAVERTTDSVCNRVHGGRVSVLPRLNDTLSDEVGELDSATACLDCNLTASSDDVGVVDFERCSLDRNCGSSEACPRSAIANGLQRVLRCILAPQTFTNNEHNSVVSRTAVFRDLFLNFRLADDAKCQ